MCGVAYLLLWISVLPLVLGWTPVVILSDSMSPSVATGDIVLSESPDFGALRPGMVIVFDDPTGRGSITHRIVEVTPEGEFVTKGDASRRADSTPVPPALIRGVGRILIPSVGRPLLWANQGQWLNLAMFSLLAGLMVWLSRWALLDQFDPWLNRGSGPGPTRGQWRERLGRQAATVAGSITLFVVVVGALVGSSVAAFAGWTTNSGNAFGADVLAPPTGLLASEGKLVTLDWTASTDSYAEGHRVLRSTTQGGPYSLVAELSPRTTVSYVDNPAVGQFFYVVRSYSPLWESLDSIEVSAWAEDFDAFVSAIDNCPGSFNLNQYDSDGDGTGDDCDPTPTTSSPGLFSDSGQMLGTNLGRSANLGDLDGDGDLDAFVVNQGEGNRVWINNGAAVLSDTGQSLGTSSGLGARLGDVDGDGDLDAFVANYNQANRIWLNNGAGVFTDSGQALGLNSSTHVALGDVDGDGDLDAFVANFNQANRIWLNNGAGVFTDSGQALGTASSRGVEFGDVDVDGDLDVVVANQGQANVVLVNNGSGLFSSAQALGASVSRGVAIGDLDGDGDRDLMFTNYNQPSTVWFNNGSGVFTDSGQGLGSAARTGLSFGDLDGDGDLDAVTAVDPGPNEAWFNNGAGYFTASVGPLGSASYRVALGDLDGDGDLDVMTVSYAAADKVWLNGP